jgi:methyl coenzyme M reductase subunit C
VKREPIRKYLCRSTLSIEGRSAGSCTKHELTLSQHRSISWQATRRSTTMSPDIGVITEDTEQLSYQVRTAAIMWPTRSASAGSEMPLTSCASVSFGNAPNYDKRTQRDKITVRDKEQAATAYVSRIVSLALLPRLFSKISLLKNATKPIRIAEKAGVGIKTRDVHLQASPEPQALARCNRARKCRPGCRTGHLKGPTSKRDLSVSNDSHERTVPSTDTEFLGNNTAAEQRHSLPQGTCTAKCPQSP